MSIHANQAKKSGPSAAGSTEIMGSNPTYRSKVQANASGDADKAHETVSKSDNTRKRDASVDGASRTTKTTSVQGDPVTGANVNGYGSGHYTKA